ncbi:Phytosulfokines 5 [Hordeum vulgare]|nr:Phytosulfokines 5 [Hordeum vulgare]
MAAAKAADAAAPAATKEEAIRARICKKRKYRNTRALAREQKVSHDKDNSGDEQIRLGPYCVFDRYFRENDDKGFGKGKGSRG